MNEGFDAGRDCVTGAEVYPWDMLKAATEQRFDGLPDTITGWAYLAALAVLKDLSWRNGIGPALKECDKEARRALTQRVCDIIEEAARETTEGLDAQIESLRQDYDSMLNRSVETGKNLADVTGLDSGRIFSTSAANVAGYIRDLKQSLIRADEAQRWNDGAVGQGTIEEAKRRKAVAEALIAELKAAEVISSLPDISVVGRDGKLVRDAVLGFDIGADGKSAICVRLLDLPETVDRLSTLERERDEAVARADIADYTREALAARCMDLEARLAVDGADGHDDPERSEAEIPWRGHQFLVGDESFLLGVLPGELERLDKALEAFADPEGMA